jgi:hypothetical protein
MSQGAPGLSWFAAESLAGVLVQCAELAALNLCNIENLNIIRNQMTN